MKNKKIFAVMVVVMAALLISVGPVLAKGKFNGKFTATRCLTDYTNEQYSYTSYFSIDRKRYTYQYSEWNVTSDNRLVQGFFIDWNTEGDLKDESPYSGVYKGQFYLVPEAARGVWVGEWILVFKQDGNKVFTGEGVGKGGELEGLTIKIYYEAEPGTAPVCAAGEFEDFSGKILRR
jgi:hypothetical protein